MENEPLPTLNIDRLRGPPTAAPPSHGTPPKRASPMSRRTDAPARSPRRAALASWTRPSNTTTSPSTALPPQSCSTASFFPEDDRRRHPQVHGRQVPPTWCPHWCHDCWPPVTVTAADLSKMLTLFLMGAAPAIARRPIARRYYRADSAGCPPYASGPSPPVAGVPPPPILERAHEHQRAFTPVESRRAPSSARCWRPPRHSLRRPAG